MALRVDQDGVKLIISTELTDILPFIQAANRIIEDHLEGQGLADATLREIERWLSAHFVAIRENSARVTEESIEDASAKYGGTYGMGLKSTLYGQTALALDSTDVLSTLDSPPSFLRVVQPPC